jgi:hypothetical protein
MPMNVDVSNHVKPKTVIVSVLANGLLFIAKGLVTLKVTENFKLKSLILAQIERWRHA